MMRCGFVRSKILRCGAVRLNRTGPYRTVGTKRTVKKTGLFFAFICYINWWPHDSVYIERIAIRAASSRRRELPLPSPE